MFDSKGVRFVIVGVSAAASFFLLNWLFVRMGVPPLVSGIVAYALVFLGAYSAQHRWTFDGAHTHGAAFPRYLAAQTICALLSGLVSQLAVTVFAASPATMAAAAAVVSSAASYILVRYWVFADLRARR